jgi:carboxyl-terminal processing protease
MKSNSPAPVAGCAKYNRNATPKTLSALAFITFALASCGGGGGGVATPPPNSTFPPASTLENFCAAPRAGTDPYDGNRPYPDKPGTLANEKDWVRSYIDETYLWYKEVPTLNAASYATPIKYFDVLKTPAVTASGNKKDRFHFTYPSDVWDALSQSGVEAGYGVQWALLSASPPRKLLVAYTDPNTPAAAANVARGAAVLTVDGVDVANGADVATLNNGIFPAAAGESHTFVLQDAGSSVTRTVVLQAANVTSVPVQNIKVIPTASGNVGYMQFNDHIATAEGQLIAAINQLKAANVTDLILDIRYNGGGYLDIASELAYMIAGSAATSGKTFERLSYNDKNPFGLTAAQTISPFYTTTQGFSVAKGAALPQLGLNNVTVITTKSTCSASESIINGLRGVDVAVNIIGSTTCGKPYGFYAIPNCGTTYFAIQFQGVNAKDFGEYTDGFLPTCPVGDDYSKQLGDPSERMLAGALSYRATGVCPAATAINAASKIESYRVEQAELLRSPLRELRIVTKPK